MLQANQVVYYTSGPVVQEAVFDHYAGKSCVLRAAMGMLTIRPGRVYTVEEATEKGLLNDKTSARVREAFAV